MKKKLTAICRIYILAMVISMMVPRFGSSNEKTWVDSVFTDSTKWVYKKEEIDTTFIREAGHRLKRDIGHMANPNEKFNKTDLIVQGLPRTRLILFCEIHDYQLLAYEQGGRGFHTQVIMRHKLKFRESIALVGDLSDRFKLKSALVKEMDFRVKKNPSLRR